MLRGRAERATSKPGSEFPGVVQIPGFNVPWPENWNDLDENTFSPKDD